MPYPNMPRELWGAMERCTADLKKEGKVKNPYAVCYTSIMAKYQKSHKK